MKTQRMDTNSALMSLNDHGTPDFPVQFYTDEFRNIRLGHIKWHWHRQPEFSYVLAGQVLYGVGDARLSLSPGQGVFLNSNALHMARPAAGEDAVMLSVIFDASMLSPGPGSAVHEKYVAPLLGRAGLSCLPLREAGGWQGEALGHLQELAALDAERPRGFELLVQNRLCGAWQALVLGGAGEAAASRGERPGQQRLKAMISFIQNHYFERVALGQIAAAANISKSECIRAFKAGLGTTPIDYLIEFRVSKAVEMLEGSDLPLSDIGGECGFESASYFAKVFRERTGWTPTACRRGLRQ